MAKPSTKSEPTWTGGPCKAGSVSPDFSSACKWRFAPAAPGRRGGGRKKKWGFADGCGGGGEGDEVAVSQHQAMKKSGFTKSSGLGCAPPHTHTHSGGGE